MSRYEITLARAARRELEALETQVVARVWARIQALGGQARPPGCRKVQGKQTVWRIRVGVYRVLYAINDARRIIDIVASASSARCVSLSVPPVLLRMPGLDQLRQDAPPDPPSSAGRVASFAMGWQRPTLGDIGNNLVQGHG